MRLPFCRSKAQRPLVAGVRLGVLLVVWLGLVLSTLGLTKSHGIAELAAAKHASYCIGEDACAQEAAHGHDADDSDGRIDHHTADHSHDKAHVLLSKPGVSERVPTAWTAAPAPWVLASLPSRLERPPRG